MDVKVMIEHHQVFHFVFVVLMIEQLDAMVVMIEHHQVFHFVFVLLTNSLRSFEFLDELIGIVVSVEMQKLHIVMMY